MALSQDWTIINRDLGSLNALTKGDVIDRKISVEDFRSMTVGEIKGTTKTSIWKNVNRTGLSQAWLTVTR